jgi:hypothetical protein
MTSVAPPPSAAFGGRPGCEGRPGGAEADCCQEAILQESENNNNKQEPDLRSICYAVDSDDDYDCHGSGICTNGLLTVTSGSRDTTTTTVATTTRVGDLREQRRYETA